jgi:valyl-tRNA synthetase
MNPTDTPPASPHTDLDEMATSLWRYSLQQSISSPAAAPVPAPATTPAIAPAGGKAGEKSKKAKKTSDEAKTEKKKPKETKVKEKAPEVKYVDETPAGMKKILTNEFPATYQPSYVEAAWQQWWEKSGFYKPNLQEALQRNAEQKFVMVIPPPNVTGSLHLGHALTSTIEDTLTRWYRMKGCTALWVPGVDHAGIATQSVVEKRLYKVRPSSLISSSSGLTEL